MSDVASVAKTLKQRFDTLTEKSDILKAPELKALYGQMKNLAPEQRRAHGQAVNALKQELEAMIAKYQAAAADAAVESIDVTAPFDVNTPADKRPQLLTADNGSRHPLITEMNIMLDILQRMGFEVVEARQIDDDYHMFGSLNFPEGHPARDDFDTFVTVEKDKQGKPFVAPAHTSIMQNRVLKSHKPQLQEGRSIAVVVPGRVFRNEDVDARHEHTFYQLEGVYVGKDIHAGHLMATLKAFMQEYYQKELDVKTQPFYFPFTEPSFEFAQSCPFCDKKGCNICSYSGWIELLGCGMIHPNVLKEAGIDSNEYTGFAWGVGFMRMAMIKYGIEDIRHFQSGKLDFLRQFAWR